jgi:hypothetical protein
MIGPQRAQPLGNACFVKPIDLGRTLTNHLIEPFGTHELNSAGAVLADAAHEREWISCRDLKASGPAIEDSGVVGQQTP